MHQLFLLTVTFLSTWTAAQHNPLKNPYICGIPSCKANGKFKYGPGTQQNYKYSVQVNSFFNGTSRTESSFYVEGIARLAFLTTCDGLLTLSDVKLSDNIPGDVSKYTEHINSRLFAEEIMTNPLRFSFKDGIISELCPREHENEWVLNFKRGILTMLHNSMKRFDLDYSNEENDIRGKCPTKYRVIGAKETSLLIEKIKDLDRCEEKSKLHSMVQTYPTSSFKPNLRSDSILKSSSHCTLSIDHNIYNEITCKESYMVQPFSNNGMGASSVITQRLILIEETSDVINDEFEISRRVPLQFDHYIPSKSKEDDMSSSLELIKQLCKQNKMQDRTFLANLYSQLINNLRQLSDATMKTLHKRTSSTCPTGKKHFLDVLQFVNSAASVDLMKDIILNNLIPDTTVDEWMMSIAFIPTPNDAMMETVSTLLEKKKFSVNIALSIATLAHTYCIQKSNCKSNNAINSIVNYLENEFLQMYQQNQFDRPIHDNMIGTLKALSNIGVISDDFEIEILKVIRNSDLDVTIRLAAIEIFRRSVCQDTRRHFEQLYRNQDEDAEVRIAAYLQIMRCPNYLLIRDIKHSLLNEEVNQVGSFVWTHLSNIIKTAVPSKVEIQSLLSEKDLIKKFSSDVRKFSHNFERSVYFDEYNFGGNYENNVIFSPSSYIPKSANFNVTVDIFGESVNIFEVYCRMDNFQHYLESLFGSKGTSNNLDDDISTTVKDNIIDRIRWLRSANEKDIVKTEVEKLPNVMRSTDNEPKVAMGLKVFGNDVKYVTYHGQTELRSAVETLNPVYHLKRLLSGKEINYSKAAMFLDSKYVTSTGAGLPLSLMLTGTAFVNIKLYGSLGTAQVSKGRKLEMELTADIQPTVSLDITGELSVDACYTNSGIKLKSNLYTDTAIKGDIKIRGTELVSVKFSLPRKKNEIMVASSELLIKENGIYQQLEEPSKKRVSNSICSWPLLDETVGLKLCTEYNFINVTDIENNPYFIIAGPAKFRSYLHKADPSANIYLFEYKWIHRKDSSIISLTFDTPGSTLKRLVSVNLTIDRQSQNLTLMLQSSNSTILAKGKYKNMPAEKLFQVALDINNKKHFDATISLLREQIKNGFSYKPTIYLGVNDERVVKFSGFVELMSKKGISQYTVDLRFETKRLFSRLYGYISKSSTSLEASLFNDYKFQNTKEQRVVLKFGVANRSRKNLVVFLGFCNLYSTAYPNMNIAANSTFQKSGAHMDLIVKMVQNPLGQDNTEVDVSPLNFDLKISYKSFTDNKRILKILSSIDKKSSNLALKGEFIYETYRHDMNIASVVNYGDNKEVSVMIFWSHPRSTLEEIKTHVNITIPSFTPMILKLEIDEKQPKDYMINCRGTWFSGHSISAIGFYQDKSTSHSSNRHLKFFIKSPSFKDLNIDLQYYRVSELLKLDIKGLYDNMDDYNLYLKHQTVSAEETKSQLRIKYKNKLYNFNSSIYDSDYKKIIAEIHIDQLRDIVFIIHAHNLQDNKGLGIEVNWDANRDPTQKLIVSALYKKLAPFNNLANFVIMYPGRFIKGDYNFIFQDQHLNTLASISWNGGTFGINMDVLYKYINGYYIEISSQVVTPFNKWNRVKLEGKFEHLNHKYDFHGVVSWSKHERVAIGVFGDYESNPSHFNCKYSCSIDSSFDRIPSINTTISHGQNETNFDTNLYVKYNPDFVIGVDSHWKIDSDDSSTNLTGTVHSRSPFKGLDKGIFFGKIFVKNMTYLKGVAQVDIDHKKLTINTEGHFKKITNCMLIVNITAPEDEYQLRLITSTEKRHFVALLTYPTGNFGTEILLSISSLTNFDIKLHLATPVEFLQDIKIIAKLKPTEADFRAGWNFLLLGFSGVWHYANVTDFKYLYKIYTPIDGFEENGVVGKLLLKEGLDLEMSIKLSYYKLGIRLLGQSKSTHFDELDLKIKNIYLGSKLSGAGGNDNGDTLNWVGLIELDIIIYPTIKGKVEIDQKGSAYILQSKLTTPHGVAHIFDEFIYLNIFNIKNSMQISTPYQQMNRITSDFELTIQKGTIYVFGLDFDYQNQTQLVQNGVWVKYFTESKEPEIRNYNLTLEVNTLLKAFPKLNVFGSFETEENFYHTKLLLNTNGGDILLDATVEIDGGLLELTSSFHVKTPFIYIPSSQLRLSKLFSVSNNYLEVELNMVEKLKRNVYMKTSWLIESQKQYFTVFQLETPFVGLENTTVGVDLQISNASSKAWIAIQLNPLEIEIDSILMDDILTASSDLNFNGRRFPLYLECKILSPSKFRKEFDGYMKLEKKLFRITGNVVLIGILPANVSITFTPDDRSSSLIFEYHLSSTAINNYDIIGRIQRSDRLTTFNINLITTDKFNWELSLRAISPINERFMVNCQANSEGNVANLIINAETPIPKLEKPRAGLTYNSERIKSLIGFFELTEATGKIKLDLLWNFLEDMLVKIKGNYQNQYYSSESSVEAFYKNPQKLFLTLEVGGDIKIDKIWSAGSNLTVKLPLENHLGVEAHLKLPDDNNETHSIFGNLNYTESFTKIESFLKYRTLNSMKRYGSGIQISSIDRQNLSGNIDLEWNNKKFDTFANLQMLDDKMDFICTLKTPKFEDKQLLVTKINYYKASGDHHNVTYETFYPEDRSVAYATVDYKELANMNGILNLTVPYKSLKYTGAYFKTETNSSIHNRYLKIFWNDDNAVLDSKCNIHTGYITNERNIKGQILIELPLTTRHLAMVDYEYEQKDMVKNGHALVTYNASTVLLTKYKCLSISSPGSGKDTIHVEIQNNIIPVGATYIHEQKYLAGLIDSTAPQLDNKFLNMYHLQNRTKFNVTGELSVQTTETGDRYILTAIHSNRTIKLWTQYDVLDKEYKQHSRIQLSPSSWLEYNINLVNRTLDDIFDAQQAVIEVIYPKRSFTAQGFYNVSDSIVSTDVSVVWDKSNRSVEAGLDWRRVSAHREQLSLEIKHPSLEKVISFYSEYGYNKSLIDGHLVVDYSLDPDQKLTLCGKVQDNSNPLKYNYTYNIWAEHNATTLHLKSGGEFYWNPSTIGMHHTTKYQRSYLPLSTSEALARINLDNKEIELKKDNIASGLFYAYGVYGGRYPIYTANVSAIQGQNDTKGEFYINFKDKLSYFNFNLTQDGSQSFHMYGFIPDARSAVFDIRRDYDDKSISDVSSYVQLNHSRLIMSSLRWRPELTSDVQSGLREYIAQFYLETLEGINNTKQYVKAETLDAINGIWADAKPLAEELLNDLRNLTVIEEDIEEFKVFLNNSYHANEFYIKTLSDIVVTMFDELALKSHLQNFPEIVQEIWSVMGESGQKIKKSILWVLEKIRTYYKNTTEFIHGLIKGDPIEHITSGLEKLVERYDEFMKGVHVSMIQYIESLWSQTYIFIVEYWHKTLAALEPAFLKFIHYLESIVWNTGKELLDFLYQRKNEIIESPYFVQFTKFSHDVDTFYKDITGNNTIASIYKYSVVAWSFLKEKYLSLIPFGKEIMDVINEIVTELKQIGEIPSIRYMVNKFKEAYGYIDYYYDHFDIENRIHKLLSIVYMKFSEMYVTAIEVENRQRIAKTKFIFEPNDGVMLLEQKLPMPWHAFNQTPNFREIPEIKRIYNFLSYLEASHISFWNIYYDYKPYMDLSDWLPPFKGQAMLMGSKYYITFDKRFYKFEGSCTYLLAKDFIDGNFTLMVSYDAKGNTNELLVLLNGTLVRVNMVNDMIHLDGQHTERLPLQIGQSYLYRDSGFFVLKSELGYILECNMKFKICTFEISGWYSGKTAGLWGTFNNEPSDDFMTSTKSKSTNSNLDIFGDSWALKGTCITKYSNTSESKPVANGISSLCEEFFTSKVSQLSTCFSRIPKDNFLSMCLSSVTEREACISVISYINLCAYANVPLRIPDTCVKCNLLNGTEINEGSCHQLQGDDVPKTADIIFIVEAKKCNKQLNTARNFGDFIALLEKELTAYQITDSRYAVVTFGGDGVWDQPRSVVVNGKIFADYKSISHYFNLIQVGDGNKDIFSAIMFAYNLISRPGVSKNFVLIPCSDCATNEMEYDYSTIHQLLSESAISLHILMNDTFSIQKGREIKVPFGIDRRYAYTKKDVRGLVGDQPLRKSITLPKSTLGFCLPLAIETNGTVFSAKYLETDKKNAKKFATVFAKVVSRAATPRQCMECECTGSNSGISYMECYLCTTSNSTRNNFEVLGLDEEESYNINLFDGFNF